MTVAVTGKILNIQFGEGRSYLKLGTEKYLPSEIDQADYSKK